MKKLAKKYEYPPVYDVGSMSQYYIPKIEEFYVGFECEIGDDSLPTQFNKIVIKPEHFPNFLQNHRYIPKLGKFRVKYLDKIDIEELGYKVEEELDEDKNVYRYSFYIRKTDFDFDNIVGDYWIDKRHLIISNTERYEAYTSYFMGRINNKSELKVLIDQLELK